MKKKVVSTAGILVTLVLLMYAPLFATETHVVGIGVPLWVTNDDSLGYKLFPSILLDKKSGTFFEFTGSLDETLGFSSFPIPWWNVDIVTATAGVFTNNNLLGNTMLKFCPNGGTLGGTLQCNMYPRGYALLNTLGGKLFLGINMPFQGIISTGVAQFGIGYARKVSILKAGALIYFGRESTSEVQLPISFPKSYDRGSQWAKSLGTFGILMSASAKFVLPIDLSINLSFPYATDSSKVLKDIQGHTIYEGELGRSGFKFTLAGRTQIKNFKIFLGLGYTRLNNYSDEVSYATFVSPPVKFSETNISAVTSNIGLYSGVSYSMAVKDKLWLAPGLLFNIYIPGETGTLDISCVYKTCTRAQSFSYTTEEYSGFQIDTIVFLGGVGKLSKKWRITGGMSKPIFSYTHYSYQHYVYTGSSSKTDDAYSASEFTSTPFYVNLGVSGKIKIFNIDFALKTVLQRHYNPIFEPYLATSVRW